VRPGIAKRWFKFQAVGALGVAVQIACLFALREYLGFGLMLATAAAVEVSILHNFCWHRLWTWAHDGAGTRSKPLLAQLCEYNLIYSIVSVVSNVFLTRYFVEILNVHYVIANLMAIAAVGIANFLAGELFIFRPVGE
jgi:putative flippase GtrA